MQESIAVVKICVVMYNEILNVYLNPFRCNAGEYCCGEDLCCDYLTGYWYFWYVSFSRF